jgi:hypothetical protein
MGELAACQVRHFDRTAETLRIPRGKTGSRAVRLPARSDQYASGAYRTGVWSLGVTWMIRFVLL